mgnify:CR=1 FL=1
MEVEYLMVIRFIVFTNPNMAQKMKTKTIGEFILAIFLAVLMLFSGALPAKAAEALFEPENFVLIRGGEFTMGSPESEVGRSSNETQHQVKVSDFNMGKYAVTVAEFRRFVEASGYQTSAEKKSSVLLWCHNEAKDVKYTKGVNWRHGVSGSVRPLSEESHPVVYVSRKDAVAYCKWMSSETGKHFRLPTEAEREYACRAGSGTPFYTGQNLTMEQANYDGNYPYNNNPKGVYRENTVPVNSFAPNAWGLYNMHGNVWEHCSDWYDKTYYDDCKAKGIVTNPTGPKGGWLISPIVHIVRGGSWYSSTGGCRSASRNPCIFDNPDNCTGFRLVFDP